MGPQIYGVATTDGGTLAALTAARSFSHGLASSLTLQICVCRLGDFRFDAVLPQDVIVLVGGIRGLLRRSREQRLVDRLAAPGRRVLFVDY